MNILSLCDLTATALRPWAYAGHTCYAVDIQHLERHTRDGITFLPYAVTKLVDGVESLCGWLDWDLVLCWPPCTDLAVSGARWMSDKGLTSLVDALAVVDACRKIADAAGCPWMLENPVSTISTYWRKPDYTFDPYEFGGYFGGDADGYTKKTCLWAGGGFKMPERRPIDLDPNTHDRIHKAAPGPERANIRSATPAGFARAIFESHRPEVPTTNFH